MPWEGKLGTETLANQHGERLRKTSMTVFKGSTTNVPPDSYAVPPEYICSTCFHFHKT